jgi:hypothetical protein
VTTLTGIKGVGGPQFVGPPPPDRIPTVIQGVGAKIYGADPLTSTRQLPRTKMLAPKKVAPL